MTQRKPWSDSPASETDNIASTIDGAETCIRRGLESKALPDHFLRVWCHKHKVSYIFARTPINRGGLGLSKPIANVICEQKKAEIPPVRARIETTWRIDNLKAQAEKYNIPCTKDDLERIAQEDVRDVCISDNVRGLSSKTRKLWKEALSQGVRVTKMTPLHVFRMKMDLDDEFELDSDFGRYAGDQAKIDELSKFRPDISKLREEYFPRYNQELGKLAKRIGPKDAKSWLTASLPVYLEGRNPIVNSIIRDRIANSLRLGDVPRGRLTDVWIGLNQRVLDMQKESKFEQISYW